MTLQRKILAAGLVALIVSLGFVRDHVFIALNEIIETGRDPSGKIAAGKWVLTFAFSAAYLINTVALLMIIFKEKRYLLMAAASYAFLMLAAGLAGGLGSLFFSFEKVYPFVRAVMGLAQSPLVAMVLLAGIFITRPNARE